jgi:hypothetical protein
MRCPYDNYYGHSEQEDLNHFSSVHPKILADTVLMTMMGWSERKIDSIVLSLDYLEGNYPGFRGDKGLYDEEVVMVVRFAKWQAGMLDDT